MKGVTHLLSLLQKHIETFPFVRFRALMQTVNPLQEVGQLVCWLFFIPLFYIALLFFLRVCQCSYVPESKHRAQRVVSVSCQHVLLNFTDVDYKAELIS